VGGVPTFPFFRGWGGEEENYRKALDKEQQQNMSKLLDMFTQAHRAQSSGGMGFVSKGKAEAKPRAAALVIDFSEINAGAAEAAIKAGADGLLFSWDGKRTAELETLKRAIDAAKASGDNVVVGLHITGGWNKLESENLEQLKERGVNYIVLSLQAPARLLAMHIKDLELVVTVPMREGELYPNFIRNLTAFDTITAVCLDFGLASEVNSLTIEDAIHYRAVREAVRFPALLNVQSDMSEADAYTLTTLGMQAVILPASDTEATTKKQIKALRELLEKVYHEDKDQPVSLKA